MIAKAILAHHKEVVILYFTSTVFVVYSQLLCVCVYVAFRVPFGRGETQRHSSALLSVLPVYDLRADVSNRGSRVKHDHTLWIMKYHQDWSVCNGYIHEVKYEWDNLIWNARSKNALIVFLPAMNKARSPSDSKVRSMSFESVFKP